MNSKYPLLAHNGPKPAVKVRCVPGADVDYIAIYSFMEGRSNAWHYA